MAPRSRRRRAPAHLRVEEVRVIGACSGALLAEFGLGVPARDHLCRAAAVLEILRQRREELHGALGRVRIGGVEGGTRLLGRLLGGSGGGCGADTTRARRAGEHKVVARGTGTGWEGLRLPSSEVIRGHQRQSEVIRRAGKGCACRRPSTPLPQRSRAPVASSAVIRGHHRQSEVSNQRSRAPVASSGSGLRRRAVSPRRGRLRRARTSSALRLALQLLLRARRAAAAALVERLDAACAA